MRAAVFLDEDCAEGWQLNFLEGLRSTLGAEAVTVLAVAGQTTGRDRVTARPSSGIFFRAITGVESVKLRSTSSLRETLLKRYINFDAPSINQKGSEIPHDGTKPCTAQNSQEGTAHFDLLVDLTSHNRGHAQSASLRATEIWWLTFGNPCTPLNEYTGLIEVETKSNRSHFSIVRQGEGVDALETLHEGHVTTQPYFLRNRAHLLEIAQQRLLSLIRMRSTGKTLHTINSSSFRMQQTSKLNWPRLIRYVTSQMLRLLHRNIWLRWFERPRWHVAVIPHEPETPTTGSIISKAIPVREVQPPRGNWVADPFLVSYRDRTLLFVEECSSKSSRGFITAYQVTPTTLHRLGVALSEPFHLSFPFVFEYADDLYMCPESADAHQVRLYRNIGSPTDWEFDCVLIDNIKAVDSILFRHGSEWHLLTNIDSDDSGDYSSGLWHFVSQNLRGPFRPVIDLPLGLDTDAIRNGGWLTQESKHFRVGQRSEINRYGTGVSIFQVDLTGKNAYVEHEVARLGKEAIPIPAASGIHHVSATPGAISFDYMLSSRTRVLYRLFRRNHKR